MENIIIIAVLAGVVGYAALATVKHFRSKSGCCSGGAYKARVKRLRHVAIRRTFVVQGMSCQHCVNRVMEAVNALEDASAVVHLHRGEVVVSCAGNMEDSVIRAAIEKAGYTVTAVK